MYFIPFEVIDKISASIFSRLSVSSYDFSSPRIPKKKAQGTLSYLSNQAVNLVLGLKAI